MTREGGGGGGGGGGAVRYKTAQLLYLYTLYTYREQVHHNVNMVKIHAVSQDNAECKTKSLKF